MDQTNKNKLIQKLGESFEQYLNTCEAQLAMKDLSIAELVTTQRTHLKFVDKLQATGPETIQLNQNADQFNLIMRAITSTKNLGNTCYANSTVFYGLRFIPLFTEKLHNWVKKSVGKMPRKGRQMLEAFQMLHVEYMKMSGSERRNDVWSQFEQSPELAIDTRGFLTVVRQLTPEFIEGKQHDAAAILIRLLEWLKCCSDILKESVNKNVLPADIEQACFYDDYFMGEVSSTIKCLGCGHMKDGPRLETSIQFVPVPRGIEDMTDNGWIIENLLRPNQRDEYNCENCRAQPRPMADINTSYELLPRLLILQMRFEFDVVGNEYVKAKGLAPLPLELQCFCVKCNDGQPNVNHKYHLNSIVVHVGASSEGGHYFTLVRHLNPGGNNESCCRIKINTGAIRGKNLRETWFICNDTNITVISKDEMEQFFRNENQKPHLVFYARNDLVAEVHDN